MSTLLDAETILLEALDFDIPCCASDDHAAQLVVTCRFCGADAFICKKHHQEVLEDVASFKRVHPWSSVGCAHCGGRAREYCDVFRVVDL